MNVIHNEGASRFEIQDAAGVSVLEYMRDGDRVVLTHTQVPVELERQGYGSALAKAALAWAREQGFRVLPVCPFVNAYVRRRRTEYQDLVGSA